MLSVRDLVVAYGDVVAVHDVSLAVGTGEIRALIGPNGAGKSSIVNAIAGRLRAKSGVIELDGQDVRKLPRHDRVAAGLSLSPQDREVFSALTVDENLRMGAYLHRKEVARVTRRRDLVLEIFPLLQAMTARRAGSLSGGEQQMLAIGRALMAEPRVLVLDEPSAGLAPIIVNTIYKVLRDLPEQGLTLLIAEQNVAKAFKVSSYAYVLSGGTLYREGKPSELAQDADVRAAYLGAAPETAPSEKSEPSEPTEPSVADRS